MDDAVSRATNGHDAVEDMGSTTSLINRDLIRYARHIVLPGFGQEAQRRLRDSRVLVVGAGGLGSPVLLYLSAAGVGHLTILDDDVVDESNLQRQVIHRQADVGRPKALSAKDAVQRLNPHLVAEAVVARLGTDNALDLVKDHDLILDCTDNFTTRYCLRRCRDHRNPAGLGNDSAVPRSAISFLARSRAHATRSVPRGSRR